MTITSERLAELEAELRVLIEPGFICLPIDEARELIRLARVAETQMLALSLIASMPPSTACDPNSRGMFLDKAREFATEALVTASPLPVDQTPANTGQTAADAEYERRVRK